MKNIFKSFVVLGAAALVAVSCNVENIGTLYQHEGANSGVSFVSTTVSDTQIGAATTSYTIAVGRAKADAAQTVSLTNTLPEGVSVPSSISFAAGQHSADLVIDLSGMDVGTSYKGTISLANESDYSEFAISSVNVTLQKAYTFVKYGTGTYHFNGDDCYFNGDQKDLEIFKAEGFEVYYINGWCEGVKFQFSVNNGIVTVENGPTGYTHSDYGAMSINDCTKYFSTWDPKADGTGYYDAASKTFYFMLAYYVSAGYFGYGLESFTMN